MNPEVARLQLLVQRLLVHHQVFVRQAALCAVVDEIEGAVERNAGADDPSRNQAVEVAGEGLVDHPP